MYRHFILNEKLAKPEIPPNFAGDFFPTIRRIKESSLVIEDCS